MLYDNNKPVVSNIGDPSITCIENKDGSNSYQFADTRMLEYFQHKFADTIDPPRSRVATVVGTVTTSDENTKTQLNAATSTAQAATTGTTNPQLQTTRQGYGAVPTKSSINSLVNNTGAYGGGISSLVYPSDLLTNQHGYNGCYTVLFISEHQDASITSVNGFTSSKKFIESAQGSAVAEQLTNVSDEAIRGAVGIIGGAAIGGIASTTLQKFLGQKTSALTGQIASAGAVIGAVGGAFAVQSTALAQNKSAYVQLNVAIALPTPTITDVHQFTWEEHGSAIGDGILEMMQGTNRFNVENFSTDPIGELTRFANSTNERGQTIGSQTVSNAKEAIDAMLLSQTATNAGFGTAISRMAGKIANPRKEQLFKQVEFRKFSMNFQLGARSVKDMENIESIIRILKYHAYPELTSGKYLWIYPAQFDIVHYFQDDVNTHMPRHATSVLTNITVDYGGGQNFLSVHRDGSPAIIDLKLEFTEIAMLSRDSIKNGY